MVDKLSETLSFSPNYKKGGLETPQIAELATS